MARVPAGPESGEYSLYWGDLHNHNAVGYAQGSLERTYEVAHNHLDFLAFTPHAQWHDMPLMPGNAHMKWVNGFKVLAEQWPKVQKFAETNNRPGQFVSLLAYEWHSSAFGDYCLYYAGDGSPLKYFDHVRELQKYAGASGALIIPHHLAYKQGYRGANLDYLDPSLSPVVEIYSEHGLAESDRGPQDYLRHSNGPRWTQNTLSAILARGFRVGVIASTDDHLGYPGAYGEGLAGVYAKDLTRGAILEALRERRTIAVTGDRIGLSMKLNRHWMGSSIPFAEDRDIEVAVSGMDEVDRVDVLRDGRVIHRHFPADTAADRVQWPSRFLCRIEFGWGPWAALNMARTVDWEAAITLHDGVVHGVTPCFQAGPFEENRRNRVVSRTPNGCRMEFYTSRRQAFEDRATNAVILEGEGAASSRLELKLSRPSERSLTKSLGELVRSNSIDFTGPFTSEAFVIHRLVTPDLYRCRFRVSDRGHEGKGNWYLVRVTQANGHQAWSSPVWVGA